MNKMTKKLAVVLAMGMLGATLGISCGRKGTAGEEDKTKTQLYVNNFDGGFGTEWLEDAARAFEQKFAETSFEEGKKGVQVWVKTGKYTGPNLLTQVKYSTDHVFLTESIDYYNYISQSAMLDISDVVTTSLSTVGGEDKTIESKLEDTQKSFLKTNGKYYAVPHFFATTGIIYDVDLFNAKLLFMDQEGGFTKKNTDSGLSLGGDGVANTVDDGLPATYADFFALCEEMKLRGIPNPIIWSGQHQWYSTYSLYALAMETNGSSNTELMYTLNGTTNRFVTGFDENDKPVIGTKEITNDNAYDAYGQVGFYHALDFMKTVVSNKYYHNNSFNGSKSHTETHQQFLLSNRDPQLQPIGMMLEGNWWENEAIPTFNSMDGAYPNAGKMDRKFGFMPLPKATSEYVGENHTMLETNLAYMFIKATIDENMKDCAKKFVMFLNTDANLQKFSETTNTPRALKYDLTPENKAKMTYFGVSMFDYKNSATTDIVYQCSSNPYYYNNASVFSLMTAFAHTDIANPSKVFFDNSALTTKQFFQMHTSEWKKKTATLSA